MAQTKEGAIKVAAARVGVSVDEYKAMSKAGLKRCTKCKTWKGLTCFFRDNSRFDKHAARCRQCSSCQSYPDHMTKRQRLIEGWKIRKPSFVPPMKGKHHTEETKQKLREANTGKPGYWRGKRLPIETRRKISATVSGKVARGKDHYAFSHGRAQRTLRERQNEKYVQWRREVFHRDNYTCQHCGDNSGGNLEAHHKDGFTEYEQKRFDIDNGITLCQSCHDIVHYGKPRSNAAEKRRSSRRKKQ